MSQVAMDEVRTLETIRDAVGQATVGQVFGTPVVQDGLTVIPVAKIGGGGGSGSGPSTPDASEPGGSGGGFGLTAKPLGVFVIKSGGVSWRPAIDVNKVIIGGQLVAVTALIVVGTLIRARARARAGDGIATG